MRMRIAEHRGKVEAERRRLRRSWEWSRKAARRESLGRAGAHQPESETQGQPPSLDHKTAAPRSPPSNGAHDDRGYAPKRSRPIARRSPRTWLPCFLTNQRTIVDAARLPRGWQRGGSG